MTRSLAADRGAAAVLLNANAGRMRPRMVRRVRKALPDAPIFWTRSFEEAQDAVEAAIESECSVLFAGGGDGTVMDVVARSLAFERAPVIAILRLGTGNALATWAGCKGVDEDLAAFARGDALFRKELRVMTAHGERFPFAGLGWDAAILNDYRDLKKQMEATPLRKLSHQVWVYLAAVFGRTVPRLAMEREAPIARILVTGGTAWRVDSKGERVGPVIEAGATLYEGPAHISAVGTVPYYGYALRIFPQAEQRASHMHLRVSAMDVGTVVNEIHRLWTGELDHPALFDFLVESVRIEYDRPMPYQVGGDARGKRQDLDVAMCAETAPMVAFSV